MIKRLKKKSIFDSILITNPHLGRHKRYLVLSYLFAATGILLFLAMYLPSVWYWISDKDGAFRTSIFLAQTGNTQPVEMPKPIERPKYIPKEDLTLPDENMLNISWVGIDTPILEAAEDDFEVALKKGVWRVPGFATPEEQNRPIILAAHRYGYLEWTVSYRLKNSFYNLPKLKVGDTIDIYWKQRKYTYAVFKEEEGENITNYTADLILYTCKYLNSPVKLFKYAKLLRI